MMISAHMKEFFFDRQAMKSGAGNSFMRVLSKFGAYVRQKSKTSIRSSKKSSAPGQPPRSHTGFLKQYILFAYERETHNVVIGPTQLNMVSFSDSGGSRPVTGTIPEVLEYGGEIHSLQVQHSDGTWTRANLRSRRRLEGKPIKMKTSKIQSRPFMHPAFNTVVRDDLPAMWAGSFTK